MPSSTRISLADLAEATGIAANTLAVEVAAIQQHASALMVPGGRWAAPELSPPLASIVFSGQHPLDRRLDSGQGSVAA